MFRHLVLATADPVALRPFYAETLALPVADTDDGFVVSVGRSALEFRSVPTGTPSYHVAFTIPGGSIEAAATWLGDRTPLLGGGDGRFRFDFLDADAVYAADPAGNVLELIARDARDGPVDPVGPDSLLDVGEIGLVVDDVSETAAALAAAFGLSATPESDESFTYLGGDEGAFVLVPPGRAWYPTERPAASAPVTVVVEGAAAALSLAGGDVAVIGIGP